MARLIFGCILLFLVIPLLILMFFYDYNLGYGRWSLPVLFLLFGTMFFLYGKKALGNIGRFERLLSEKGLETTLLNARQKEAVSLWPTAYQDELIGMMGNKNISPAKLIEKMREKYPILKPRKIGTQHLKKQLNSGDAAGIKDACIILRNHLEIGKETWRKVAPQLADVLRGAPSENTYLAASIFCSRNLVRKIHDDIIQDVYFFRLKKAEHSEYYISWHHGRKNPDVKRNLCIYLIESQMKLTPDEQKNIYGWEHNSMFAAIRELERVGDKHVVQTLINVLGSNFTDDLKNAAAKTLTAITGEDLGVSAEKWNAWSSNAGK